MENKKEFINTNMQDVIKTTREARDLLFKDGKILDHTDDDIQVVRQVVSANKNIVSASVVLMSVEKLK